MSDITILKYIYNAYSIAGVSPVIFLKGKPTPINSFHKCYNVLLMAVNVYFMFIEVISPMAKQIGSTSYLSFITVRILWLSMSLSTLTAIISSIINTSKAIEYADNVCKVNSSKKSTTITIVVMHITALILYGVKSLVLFRDSAVSLYVCWSLIKNVAVDFNVVKFTIETLINLNHLKMVDSMASYDRVVRNIAITHSISQWQMLFAMLAGFTTIGLMTVLFITGRMRLRYYVAVGITWGIHYGSYLFLPIILSESMNKELRQLKKTLLKDYIKEKPTSEHLIRYKRAVMRRNVKFTPVNMFEVDFTLAYAIVGALAAYTIILIQMEY